MTDFRPLVEAVLEALSLPAPATVGDRIEHDQILNHRVMYARILLKSALKNPNDVEWAVDYLRERLAEHPPTYRAADEVKQ
ncbi:hypothetical protein AB0B78_12995 [Streptomyces sp. NPDC040724]|uniref:hypothetical protein n=1 Tax=Streptomyces sp. NPDC040724 TaxID=3155612 RepID=UPI0033C64BE3